MAEPKVVIISDTHLTKKFSPAKFELLKKIITNCDQLIINGDLWEGFSMSAQEFIASPWNQLFGLFKQKGAIYLFGNHDPQDNSVDYRQMVASVARNYEFSQNGVDFYVVHGDYLDPTFDMRHPNLPKWILNIGSLVDRMLIQIFGWKYLEIYRWSNNKMKRWHQSNQTNKWLICGHSHLPEVDQKNKFANSGIFLKPGLASYLTVTNGQPELQYV